MFAMILNTCLHYDVLIHCRQFTRVPARIFIKCFLRLVISIWYQQSPAFLQEFSIRSHPTLVTNYLLYQWRYGINRFLTQKFLFFLMTSAAWQFITRINEPLENIFYHFFCHEYPQRIEEYLDRISAWFSVDAKILFRSAIK